MSFADILSDEEEQKRAQEAISGSLKEINFNDILVGEREAKKNTLRGNLYSGTQRSADDHARTQNLSNEAGMDPAIVQGNEDTIEKANMINKIDYDGIIDQSPGLSRFMMDPKKAALIQDEVTDWYDFSNTWHDLGESVEVGRRQVRTGELGFRDALAQLGAGDALSPDEQSEFSSIEFGRAPSEERGFFAGVPFAIAEQGANILGSVEEGFKTGVKGAGGAAALAGTAALVTGPGAAPAASAAAITTFPFFFAAGSIAHGIEQESGNAYHEFLQFTDDEGNLIDRDIAAIAGLLSGATSGSIEGIANKLLITKIPGVEKFISFFGKDQIKKMLAKQSGRDVMKRMAGTFSRIAATEGTTEAIQEVLIILGGEAAKMADEGNFDNISADDFYNRVEESFVKGVQVGGGIGSANVAVQGAADINRVNRANKNMQAISDRIDAILGSKLAGRSDQMMEELYQSIADSKGDADTSISPFPLVNQLQEAGVDVVDFFGDMGVTAEELNEALQSGGDLVVKSGKVLTAAKNTEFKDLILANIRQDPNAMTALEAEDHVGRVEEDAAAAIERLNADAEIVQAMESQADEVFDAVVASIGDAGVEAIAGQRFPVAELYRGLALRQIADWAAEGKEFDAVEFYSNLGLNFTRKGFPEVEARKQITDPQLSGLLNELRTAKTGKFEALERSAFGPSISERAREFGINDERGDLLSQDVDLDRAIGQKSILREEGISLDEVGENLLQEGFFQERPTTDQVIQAIVNDLRAATREQRGFVPSNVDEKALSRLQSLEALDVDLNKAGLSLDEMTNEQIIAALNVVPRETFDELFQQAAGIDTPEFKNWFKDSKVVDENGDPLVVFHGTAETFEAFDAEKTVDGLFWFTNDRSAIEKGEVAAAGKGEIMDVYLSIQNPAGWAEYNKFFTEELINQGFDGLILEDGDQTTYVAFENTQIKSTQATRFDPEDPRTMFQKVVDGVKGLFGKKDEDEQTLFQRAFHGTQAQFGEFDPKKIGSADGNDKFGHGVYFASNQGVAREYITTGGRVIEAEIPNDNNFIDWDGSALDMPVTLEEIVFELDTEDKIDDLVEELNENEDVPFSVDPEEQVNAYLTGANNFDDISDYATDDQLDTLDKLRSEIGFDAPADELTGGDVYSLLAGGLGTKKQVSEFLTKMGVKGIKAQDKTLTEGDFNFVIFDPKDIKIIDSDVSDQREQKGPTDIRGGIRGDFGNFNSQFEIFVTPDQNLSTLLHETGHLFLEIMGREAALPDAPKRVQDNLQAALEFLGVDKFEDIQDEHHEKWARTFEVYLREGKAPNARMQRVFDKFRAWLVNTYKRLIGIYDIEISDEVRGIFDTLLASEIEVTQAEADNAFVVNSDITELMSESEKTAYFVAAQKAHDEGVTETLQKQMKIQQRETMKWWKAERKKTKLRMTDEVWNEQLYQAWHFMAKGEFFERETPDDLIKVRVNREKLIDTFGTEGVLQDMPKTVPPMWKIKGGLHPDELAEMVGYASGYELMTDIMNAERPAARIERLTTEEMDRNNPVPDISLDATEATFNDQRGLFLANELKALRRKAGEEFEQTVIGRAARSPLGIMKAAVAATIDRKPVREITKPFIFLNNSQRAAKDKTKAIIDKDFQAAATASAKQLFNFLMFRESLKVQDQTRKITKRLSAAANKPIDPRKIDPDYITAIKDISKAILSADDPQSTPTLRAAVEWSKAQENDPDNPANLVIPAMFEGDYDAVSVKDMTFTELQSVDSMIKSLREEGKRRGDEVAAVFRQKDHDMAQDVEKNVKRKKKSPIGKSSSRQAIEDNFAQYLNAHVKATQFFREMDGFEDQGPIWTTFMGRASEMEDNETIMLEDKLPQLRDIYKKHFTKTELTKSMWQKVNLGDFGELSTVTRQQLLSLAMNFGNQENIDAIAEGYNVNAADLFTAMDEFMSEKDWQFVQETLDLIDTFWPDIHDLEMKMTGVAPRKVEATQILSKSGTFKGGYYPLQYDQRLSVRADKNVTKEKFTLMASGRISRGTTKQGHTKERVGSGGQAVKLDLNVAFTHINDVIHDLTHREGIIEMSRLLNGRAFTKAITDTLGTDVHRNLRNWLVDIGAGNVQPVNFLDKLLRRVRIGTTIVTMGFSLSTMMIQVLGYASTLNRLGAKQTIKGMNQFFLSPREGWKFVFEASPFMRKRFDNFDRDVNAFASSVTRAGVTEQIANIAFKGIGFMDLMVSIPTWLGAYDEGMSKFDGDHKIASRHADAVVQESQGSGATKDLAGIMRGSEGARLLTMFMSYFSAMHNLLREDVVQLKNGGISPARFALHMLYLVILPPVIEGLMRGEEPDDDDEWAQWAGKKVGGYTFSTLVGVRDVANLWTTDYGFGFSPVAQALKQGFEGTKALVTAEDTTDYQVRQAVSLFGILTRTPTKKVYDQFDYWMKVIEGEEDLKATGVIFNKRER